MSSKEILGLELVAIGGLSLIASMLVMVYDKGYSAGQASTLLKMQSAIIEGLTGAMKKDKKEGLG